jgi:hypothetical protein
MKCSCCAILRTSFPIRAILEHGRCLRGLVRQSTISLDVDGWCTMVSSKPLLLLSAVACLTLSCPLLATAQDTDSQQSSKSSNTGLMVRRFALHYNGSFKRISPDEITQRLTQKGLLPLVEQPYNQTKLDLVKSEIKKIYKEKGIAVSAESVLNATSTPRYVEVFIEVFKL